MRFKNEKQGNHSENARFMSINFVHMHLHFWQIMQKYYDSEEELALELKLDLISTFFIKKLNRLT